MSHIKGVNLGGWLVLERWITPNLFGNCKAVDEFGLCEELGDQKNEIIKKHRDSFITQEDFKWIAKSGLNAVRIPVGYWLFGDEEPYVGTVEYLDWAIGRANQNNIGVIVDLHAAPGSQNGWKHSGKEGKIEWHKNKQNIEKTLMVIEELAKRYKGQNNLIGIELLNEPKWDVPIKVLKDFYLQGYEKIRQHCSNNVAVIISDAFRPNEWNDFMLQPNYKNVWLDCHLYQVFDKNDKALDIKGHINKAGNEWAHSIHQLQKNHPVIVGEWSAALEGNYSNQELQLYTKAQIETFNQTKGWFYWTYKTENQSAWNYKNFATKS